jgi:hypothetical protein
MNCRMSIRSSGTPMLTFHRNKRGGDDFHVISEGQRVGCIYRLTSKTEGWFWAEWVPPGGKVNGVADTRVGAMAAFKRAWDKRQRR